MSSFRIRPRFKHLSPIPQKEIENQIGAALNRDEAICVGEILPGHINLKIPVSQRHFWSPQLNLSLDQSEDGTTIRGLYGPNPTIWAVFFFGYTALGVGIFFISMWGLTRMSLGLSHQVLWAVPVLFIIMIILYIVAQLGQKLGAEQMFALHHFYEEVVHDKISIT